METSYQNAGLIPNSTQVPDLILDRWMAELSGAEFKVVMYVARRTYGFRRVADDISIHQLTSGIVTRDGRRLDSGTGLSKDTVVKAVMSLIARGILLRERHRDERGDRPSTYSLNLACGFGKNEATKKAPTPVRKPDTPDEKPDTGESENLTPSPEKPDTPLSENLPPSPSENRTHNTQARDRQSDRQLDIQEATTQGDQTDVVVSQVKEQGEIESTLALVTKITKNSKSALSIIQESGESNARRQALWWPLRNVAARDSGAVFRSACRESWAEPDAAGVAEAKKSSKRRYVKAPAPAVEPEKRKFFVGLAPSERFVALRDMEAKRLQIATPPIKKVK